MQTFTHYLGSALLAVSLATFPLHADDSNTAAPPAEPATTDTDEPAETPEPHTPAVGDTAADFTLQSLRGNGVTLSELTADGPVVLLVLRGFPTYQCPICTRQVGDYLSRADNFAEHQARVVMVYPGPADHLKERAEEFMDDRVFPEHFDLLLDPDYAFTNLYDLRWDEPQETAYPSTFVIDADRVTRAAHVSHTHGNRTTAAQTLGILASPPTPPAAPVPPTPADGE